MNTEDFYALPMKERAVLVAKDVIAQIQLGRYIAQNGFYIRHLKSSNFMGEIKDSFNEISTCRVCALGATIMSCTHLGNRLKFEDVGISEEYSDIYLKKDMPPITELLTSVFSPHTLLLIETAFEGYHFSTGKETFNYQEAIAQGIHRYGDKLGERLSREECIACNDFYNKYKEDYDEEVDEDEDEDNYSMDSQRRLTAIMENIIENEGEFKL